VQGRLGDIMAETKPAKDRFPYERTWNSLTKKQQAKVKNRANKARLTIPEILQIRYVDQGKGKES